MTPLSIDQKKQLLRVAKIDPRHQISADSHWASLPGETRQQLLQWADEKKSIGSVEELSLEVEISGHANLFQQDFCNRWFNDSPRRIVQQNHAIRLLLNSRLVGLATPILFAGVTLRKPLTEPRFITHYSIYRELTEACLTLADPKDAIYRQLTVFGKALAEAFLRHQMSDQTRQR